MHKFKSSKDINLEEGDIVQNFVTKLSMRFMCYEGNMLKFEILNSKIKDNKTVEFEPDWLINNSWGLFENDRTRA